MEISSVVANAYANPAAQSERSQSAQPARQSQQAERQEPPKERVDKAEEQPRPVANAQGQTTGQVINVTA